MGRSKSSYVSYARSQPLRAAKSTSPGGLGTLGHDGPPGAAGRRTGRGRAAPMPPQSARRRFGSAVQRGAPRGIVPGQRPAPAVAPGTRPRPPRRAPGRSSRSTAVWATSVAASSVVAVRARPGGGVAELDRVAGRGPVDDREVGVDRRARPTTRWPCPSSPRPGPCPRRAIPYASAFATQRSRERAVVVHRASRRPRTRPRPRRRTRVAAASHIAMNRRFMTS